LAKLWADNKYHNHQLNRWVSENGWYVIEVVSRPAGNRKFEVVKYRWVVERTFVISDNHFSRSATIRIPGP
jgi:hypothetical protein